MPTTGDDLLGLLGLDAEAMPVKQALNELARGMEPELDSDDEEDLVDWVTVNELGLEFGFEDGAYVRALDPSLRREAPPLLSQLYFYGDTPRTRPFPFPLPLGLTFGDDRTVVRKRLAEFEETRRSYRRDAWSLPAFDVTVAYNEGTNLLESVYCHLRYQPWPPMAGETELVSSFSPEVFASLFGLRWSNTKLRLALAPLGYGEALPQVRSERIADFGTSHGLELAFTQSRNLRNTDHRYPASLAFGGVTFYASREQDARKWAGTLPAGLLFSDQQADLLAKLKQKPLEQEDDVLSGTAVWRLDAFTLTVLYSNLENRLLRVTMLAPGFWESQNEPADA